MKTKRNHLWAVIFTVLLIAFTVYFALDTFVIVRVYSAEQTSGITKEDLQQTATETDSESAGTDISPESSDDTSSATSSEDPVITGTSYDDGSISVSISTYREYDTTIYVADITVSSPDLLKTALAQSSYGKNVTEKTSEIAESNNAIIAVNGDYYGSREKGYVIRNGVLYRSRSSSGQYDLVIYEDGRWEVICEDDITAEELLANGAYQVFCLF